jgi:hypothetical protein
VSFFDEPGSSPPDPEPPSYRTPEWLAPPPNLIPATVALDVVLVDRPDLVIWVSDALVYPSGLSFGVNVQRRDPAQEPVRCSSARATRTGCDSASCSPTAARS